MIQMTLPQEAVTRQVIKRITATYGSGCSAAAALLEEERRDLIVLMCPKCAAGHLVWRVPSGDYKHADGNCPAGLVWSRLARGVVPKSQDHPPLPSLTAEDMK